MYWITFVLFSILIYLFYRLLNFWLIKPWRIYRNLRSQGIPGFFIPIVGEILRRRRAVLNNEPFSFFEENTRELGEYYATSFGPLPTLSTSDPGLIESVLKTNVRSYKRSVLGELVLASLLGYENVLVAEGANHSRHRRLINPVFQQQNINSMLSMMVESASTFFDSWKHYDKNTVDVAKEMSDLTLDIVSGCVFGANVASDQTIHQKIHENLVKGLEQVEKRIYNMTLIIPIVNELPLQSKRIVDKCHNEIQKIVLNIIDQRRQGLTKASCKGSDLLDLLLAANNNEQKQKFTDIEVSDEAIAFILAGHETTATLMSWVLHDIATNPDVYEQCQKEIDSVLEDGIDFDLTTVSRLVYTDAVLKETLRIHSPIASLIRVAIEDNTIVTSEGKPIFIEKGCDVLISLHSLHRSTKYWHEPERYDPQRFLSGQAGPMYPFGAGPRVCVGQNFAMLEVKVILSMFLRRFHIELVPGQKLVPDTTVTIRPKYGLLMRISSRC